MGSPARHDFLNGAPAETLRAEIERLMVRWNFNAPNVAFTLRNKLIGSAEFREVVARFLVEHFVSDRDQYDASAGADIGLTSRSDIPQQGLGDPSDGVVSDSVSDVAKPCSKALQDDQSLPFASGDYCDHVAPKAQDRSSAGPPDRASSEARLIPPRAAPTPRPPSAARLAALQFAKQVTAESFRLFGGDLLCESTIGSLPKYRNVNAHHAAIADRILRHASNMHPRQRVRDVMDMNTLQSIIDDTRSLVERAYGTTF